MKPRDSQRSKLYAAERRAFASDEPMPEMSVETMQALIDKWASSKVMQRRYPRARRRCVVRAGRGASYVPLYYAITMPRWGRSRRWVLVHEYAHHLAPTDVAAHGWQFCEAYLYLVRVVIGKQAEERLKAEFKAGKVRYRKPVKRQMTEAQKQAARERMRKLNERRWLGFEVAA